MFKLELEIVTINVPPGEKPTIENNCDYEKVFKNVIGVEIKKDKIIIINGDGLQDEYESDSMNGIDGFFIDNSFINRLKIDGKTKYYNEKFTRLELYKELREREEGYYRLQGKEKEI